jgi:hypothetical protein
MSDTSVMLKRKNIASKLFDSINRMALDQAPDHVADHVADHVEEVGKNYIVSVPNAGYPLKFSAVKPLEICTYQVRTDGLYPFLLFLLNTDTTFITMPMFFGNRKPKKIKYAAIAYMQTLFPVAAFTYAGFAETAERNIIILHCSEQPLAFVNDYIWNDYIWATSYELVNLKKIGKIALNQNVLDFFQQQPAFLTLKTPSERRYETPMLGYAEAEPMCKNEEVDIYRKTICPDLGKCYYLLVDLPEFTNKKIMRIAFFAGKMALNVKKGAEKWDTLLCNKPRSYIIQNYNQHVLLSIRHIE